VQAAFPPPAAVGPEVSGVSFCYSRFFKNMRQPASTVSAQRDSFPPLPLPPFLFPRPFLCPFTTPSAVSTHFALQTPSNRPPSVGNRMPCGLVRCSVLFTPSHCVRLCESSTCLRLFAGFCGCFAAVADTLNRCPTECFSLYTYIFCKIREKVHVCAGAHTRVHTRIRAHTHTHVRYIPPQNPQNCKQDA
jgi:hypothetical protein